MTWQDPWPQPGKWLITADGCLRGARQVPSAHFDERPSGTVIDLVVIHGISLPAGDFGGPYIEQLFTGRLDIQADAGFEVLAGLQVSAHLLIRRGGEVLQFVPFGKRAWHAGQSSFQGQDNCNHFSIGIELEGTDTFPYTEMQYQVLARIIRVLQCSYPAISPERIVGHSDIAPGRKADPGPLFDWDYFRRILQSR